MEEYIKDEISKEVSSWNGDFSVEFLRGGKNVFISYKEEVVAIIYCDEYTIVTDFEYEKLTRLIEKYELKN